LNREDILNHYAHRWQIDVIFKQTVVFFTADHTKEVMNTAA